MPKKLEQITYTVWWNILIITIGSVIYSIGLKGIAFHHQFIPGGVFGLGLLVYYLTPVISAGLLYFFMSIPLFAMGWMYVSKRFFYYSLYATVVATLAFEFLTVDFGIQNQLYAAIAAGAVCGAGCGLVLRSLGSNGGLDVIAVMLNQKYNLGIGKFYFLFNFFVFSASLFVLEIDLVIASLILVFIMSFVLEYTLAMFNQRKLVLIISDKSREIADEMIKDLKMGATFITGKGAYTGSDKNVIMAITNNIMLKRLEETVFSNDESAIFIVENTFNVLGSSFTKRKIY
ncbi:YitT family protein [Desulfonatronovibrio hydrogenovorans]|uniref:YitT family protein n=1 Tax=Desulfonatronovibrio hydrogenovorans TaxID=53245 RepID=UPI00048E277C|nr:YitT family protein [Desulfonatronovibrio hydrogenovorans]